MWVLQPTAPRLDWLVTCLRNPALVCITPTHASAVPSPLGWRLHGSALNMVTGAWHSFSPTGRGLPARCAVGSLPATAPTLFLFIIVEFVIIIHPSSCRGSRGAPCSHGIFGDRREGSLQLCPRHGQGAGCAPVQIHLRHKISVGSQLLHRPRHRENGRIQHMLGHYTASLRWRAEHHCGKCYEAAES